MRLSRLSKQSLARAAFSAAYKFRSNQEKPQHEAINVIDVSIKLGISVRYVDLPSLEGMFVRQPASIYVSALRPTPRQNFTCAHELGHYCFNHGSQVEELVQSASTNKNADPNEYIANVFAASLLMPSAAIAWICKVRGGDLRADYFTSQNVYSIATRLGVGYSTLTNQLYYGLNLIQTAQYRLLGEQNLKSIRKSIVGDHIPGHLIDVHFDWIDTPIDLRVGDYLYFRFLITADKENLEKVRDVGEGALFLAKRPGIVTVRSAQTGWANQVRVSRPSYTGLAEYRHLDDPDYE